MANIDLYNSFGEAAFLADTWNQLRQLQGTFFPTFDEARCALEASGCEFRIAVVRQDAQIASIACFVFKKRKQLFKMGERALFSIPVKAVDLYGGSVLGSTSENIIQKIMAIVSEEWRIDIINIGEAPIASMFRSALSNPVGASLVATRPERKNSLHWLIELPGSFEEYLSGLGKKTKRNIVYYTKKLEKEASVRYELTTAAGQAEHFLREASRINRLTYKWRLGQNIDADQDGILRYTWLAEKGQLRCYLMYIDDCPAAFMGGQLCGDWFLWETSGYDPKYEKASVGTILLSWAIRDLIESANCQVLDFGSGGDDRDYKSKFGNKCIEMECIQLASIRSVRGIFIVVCNAVLTFIKNMMDAALGSGRLRQRVKKAARQYGGN